MKSTIVPLFKKTKRLVLRPLTFEDHSNWSQAYQMLSPAQNEWDEGPWDDSELTLQKFKAHVKQQRHLRAQDKFYEFGIFQKNDGVLVGFVHLMDVSRGRFQNAYLGYRIFNNYWGHGYAQESVHAIVKMAFRDLKLHRVEAGIQAHNKKSIRVAKAIGLRKEGTSLRRIKVHGKWIDLGLYAMTAEELRK
jgi:ribosomal-protein-alanine N-acetyltransferase